MHRDTGRDPELSVQATAGTGAGEGEAVTDETEAFFNIADTTHSVGVLYRTGSSHPYELCDQIFHISQLTDSTHVHLSLVTKDLKFPQGFY